MERAYRIAAPAEPVADAGPPPRAPDRTLAGRCEWDVAEPDFEQIIALREWLEAQAIDDVVERGLCRTDRADAARAHLLHLGLPSEKVAASVAEIVTHHPCEGCGFLDERVATRPRLELALAPAGPLAYVSQVGAVIMARDVVAALHERGVAGGLRSTGVHAPGHVAYELIWSDRPLGMPAAPFGDDGERCPVCGRNVVRANDRTYPARPRYGFFETYHRPPDGGHWFCDDIDGPLRPLVTADVRDVLWEHDPGLAARPLGWYPDAAELAFLDERYRAPS